MCRCVTLTVFLTLGCLWLRHLTYMVSFFQHQTFTRPAASRRLWLRHLTYMMPYGEKIILVAYVAALNGLLLCLFVYAQRVILAHMDAALISYWPPFPNGAAYFYSSRSYALYQVVQINYDA